MRIFLAVACLLVGACGNNPAAPNPSLAAEPAGEAEPVVTVPPTRSGEVAAEIPADGVTLAGTIRIPEDPSGAGVVFIHGSGPVDRDARLPGQLNMVFPAPIALFEELAAALGEAGVASLRYDKRTCGPFNGCADNDYPTPARDISVDDFIADAEAATFFLLDQPEIERVFAIGHSQGGTFVPILLERNPELSGGIMLATPSSTIDVVLQQQADLSRSLAEQAGMQPGAIDAAIAPLDGLAEAVSAIRAGTFAGEDVGGASAAFWSGWIDRSEAARAAVRSVPQPLLIVSGSLDWNVSPSETEAWSDLVTPGTQIEVLPCLTHAFNCVTQSDPLQITPTDIGRTVDASLPALLIEFVD